MKIKYILLFGAIAAFSSCSTAYRTAQTPDDVYYSPAPAQSGYANSENDYLSPTSDQDANSYAYRNSEEAQIRAGIQDPIYRNPISLDLGFGYGYNSLGLGSFYNPYYYGGYNPLSYMSLYNPYMPFGYGGLYNPYYSFYSPYYSMYNPYGYGYGGSYYGSGHSYYPGTISSTYTGPRRFNLNPYTNRGSGAVGTRGNTGVAPYTPSTPIRRTTGVGNVIRRIVSPNRDTYVTPNNNRTNRVRSDNSNNVRNNNNNYNRPPERTFNNTPQVNNSPSVSTPSSGGGGGGSAPVRTFRR